MGVMFATLIPFAVSAVGTPGPANMAMMAAGARYGLRAALPFVAGVALGKQLIIWPIGFGLMELATRMPALFAALKYLSAAYILWLAWKIAGSRMTPGEADTPPPSFAAGLIVHPLNPKAWALITAAFTNFVTPGTPALTATFGIAATLLAIQAVLHPMWAYFGARIARVVAGTAQERVLMIVLAGLTAASVLYVLIAGEL